MLSTLGGLFGTIVPAAVLIILGVAYLCMGKPIMLTHESFFPDFSKIGTIVLAASIFLFYGGMEMNAVSDGGRRHVGGRRSHRYCRVLPRRIPAGIHSALHLEDMPAGNLFDPSHTSNSFPFFLNSALLTVFTIIVAIFRKSFVFRIDPSYY